MTFTAKKIKEDFKEYNPNLLESFKVAAKDRIYQIWERNAITIDLFSPKVFHQKINYALDNPIKAVYLSMLNITIFHLPNFIQWY